MKANVGDWICWQIAGRLHIAEIRYITGNTYDIGGQKLVTDSGSCGEDHVLELRPKARQVSP